MSSSCCELTVSLLFHLRSPFDLPIINPQSSPAVPSSFFISPSPGTTVIRSKSAALLLSQFHFSFWIATTALASAGPFIVFTAVFIISINANANANKITCCYCWWPNISSMY